MCFPRINAQTSSLEEKKNTLKEGRKIKDLSLFSWLSVKMRVCYSLRQGETMQHGGLAPQNWV